ncbi:phage lipoprotein [Proteus vulgaris]|uniref:Phage lipoprotein n=1 Tax=Proteus vulgaris TaxID=585 RepID=A0A379FA20_PROVU|nr:MULTISPECIES: hypothetical protein [Proteus]MBI6513156.1 hypothetical protein [Proteus sp. PR00174]SUC16396.1 phage lipoprotein [Proteus vulgaris]
MKKLISIIFIFFSINVQAIEKQISAPLGLTWGMTYEEVLNKTGNIKLIGNKENRIKEYLVNTDSKLIDGIELYSVGIDDKYGLINVDMLIYVDDGEIVERYNILKQALSSKYGNQYSNEYLWKSGTKGRFTLPECLSNELCGKYVSHYQGDDSSNAMLMLGASADKKSSIIFLFYKSSFIKKIKQEEDEQQEKIIKEKAKGLADSL